MATHTVRQPEWIETAPIVVSETIEIAASPSAVWAHIADHASWPEWFTALDRVEPLGEPTGVGGGRRVIVRRLPIDEQFTAWDVDEHFAFAVVTSKLLILESLAESVRLIPIETGTQVVYRQGVEGRRGLGGAAKLFWKQPARQLAQAMVALKARVESAV